MGKLLCAAALAALCAAGSGCAETPSEESSPTSVGLRTPDSPLVTLRIAFRAGSIDDPAGRNGLNALTALMIGQGGTGALSYEELTRTLYPWSAAIAARYDKETTTIVGSVHRDYLEPFYGIVRDLLVSPRFDAADFERNREQLRNGVVATLRGNNDEELGKQALNALLYRGHPYESPELGTELGLGAITLDDVRDFHARRYTRDNFLVGAAGGYPPGFVQQVEADLRAGLPAGGPEPVALPGRP